MTEVTVIVPALEGETALLTTLLSCEQQKGVEIEVVVVGPRLLQKYLKGFPSVRLIEQNPTGLYKALNAGLANSNGEWILFLGEGDSYLAKESVKELLEGGGAGADVIAGHTLIVSSSESDKYLTASKHPRLIARWKMPFGHPGAAYKRNLFLSVGFFDESFKGAGDFDWTCRWLEQAPRFSRVDSLVAVARAGGFSTSPASRSEAIREESRVIRRYMRAAPAHFLLASLLKLTLNRWRLRGLRE